MALSCNAYGGASAPQAQTISSTQQLVACKTLCENTLELEDDEFYTVVADALERLALKLGITAAQIENLDSSELKEAVENARCGLGVRSVAPVDSKKSKALILAQLNEIICA